MSELFPGLFEDLLEAGNVDTGYPEDQPSESVSSSNDMFPGMFGDEVDVLPDEEITPEFETDFSAPDVAEVQASALPFEEQLAEDARGGLPEGMQAAPQAATPIGPDAESALDAAQGELPDPVDYSAKVGKAFEDVGAYFAGSGIPTGVANLGKAGAFVEQKAGQLLGIKGLEDYGKHYVDYWSEKVEDFSVPELNVSLIDSPMTALDPRFWNYQLGTMIPAMALGGTASLAGAGATTSAVTSGFSMSAPESIDTYESVLKETGNETTAAKAAGMHLLMNSVLEAGGLSKIIKPVGNLLVRGGKGGITEGGTEFSQTFLSEINKDLWTYSEKGYSLPEIVEAVVPKLGGYLKDSASAGLVGFGLGGGISAATGQKKMEAGVVPTSEEADKYLEERLQVEARDRRVNESEEFLQRAEVSKAADRDKLNVNLQLMETEKAARKLESEESLRRSAVGFDLDPELTGLLKDDRPVADIIGELTAEQLGFGQAPPSMVEVPPNKPAPKPSPELQANLDLMEDAKVKMSTGDKTVSPELVEPKLEATPQQAEMSKQDAIENGYQVESQHSGSMQPDEFLNLTTRSEKTIKTLEKTEFKGDFKGDEKVDTGKEFDKEQFERSPSPYIVVNAEGKIIGHEGRHRAIAARDAGIADFPVEVLYTTEARPNEIEAQYKGETKDLTEGPQKATDETVTKKDTIAPVVEEKSVATKLDSKIEKQKQKVQDSDFDEKEIAKLTELLTARDAELGVKPDIETKPKVEPVSGTKKVTTDQIFYDENKKAVSTSPSPEAILESTETEEPSVPDSTPNKKTTRKVIRKTDSDTPLGTRDSIISPEDKITTQEDVLEPVVTALLQGDGLLAVDEIAKLPKEKRKAAYKEASRIAHERNLETGHIDTDTLEFAIEEGRGSIAGRKKLGGQVEMTKDAGGMYSGTHPVSGVTYTAVKQADGYEVKAGDEVVVKGIPSIDQAMKPIKEHSESSIGPVYESKPGDADYTKHVERWKVADKDGNILEGMPTKKAAVAMREAILTGKEYVDPKVKAVKHEEGAKTALKDLGKTNLRKEDDVSQRQSEVKEIELTPELRAELEARYTPAALAKSKLSDTERIRKTLEKQKDQTVGDADYIEQEISDLFEDEIDLDEALDRVIEQTGNEGAFAVGNMLKKVISKDKLKAVKVRPISQSKSDRPGTHYDPESNTVYYSPLASPRAIVHEAVHGITVAEMRQLPKGHPLKLEINKTLTTLTDQVVSEGILSDEQLGVTLTGSKADFEAEVKAEGDSQVARVMYALRSPEEMFSMVLTDSEVRSLAKRTLLPKDQQTPKVKTLWDKVKKTVKDLLGAKGEDYTALDSILDLTYELGQHEVNGRPMIGTFGDLEENLAKAREMGVDEDGFVKGLSTSTKDLITKSRTMMRKAFRGIDEVLGDVHKDLQAKFAGYTSNVAIKTADRTKEITGWGKTYNKLSVEDRSEYSLALKNYHSKEYREVMDKIHTANPELGTEWVKVKAVLNDMSSDFVRTGMISKTRKDYFPNVIEDMKKLMNEAHKGKTHNLMAEVKAGLGENADPELVQEKMAEYLSRGVYPAMLTRPGSAKTKSIWDVTPELAQHYLDPIAAMTHHIRSGTESIEQRVLVGKSNRANLEEKITKLNEKKSLNDKEKLHLAHLESDLERHGEELEGSIGRWLSEQAYAGTIDQDKQAIVREVLKAKFNEQAMSKGWSRYKAVATATTLGQANSMLIQFTDILPSMMRNGVDNTMSAAFGKKLFTQEDIDVHSALKDLGDKGTAQAMLEWSLKATGFTAVDSLLKQTTMQAAINKAKNIGRDEFVAKYGTTFDAEGEASTLYNDLRAGKKSDNARRFAFNELAKVQPISSSQMPQYYLEHPNLRMAYSLKTYGVKMMNNIYTAGKDAKENGIELSRGKKIPPGRGAQTVAILLYASIMAVAGAGADSLKDLIMGRHVDFQSNVIDSYMKLVFASRYSASKLAQGDLGGVLGDLLLPPAGFIEKPVADIYNTLVEDRDATFKTGTMFPVVGKWASEWYSQEALGKKQRNLRDRIFALNKNMKEKQGGGTSSDYKKLRGMRTEYNSKVNKAAGERKIKASTLRESTRRRKRKEREDKRYENKEKSPLGNLFSKVGDVLSPTEAVASDLPEDIQQQVSQDKTTAKGRSQQAVLIGNSAARLGVTYDEASENMAKFAEIVGEIENDGKTTGKNIPQKGEEPTTSSGLYQFVEDSVEPAANRLARHIGWQPWMKEALEHKDAGKLPREAQTLLFMADLLEKGDSDPIMKKVLRGDYDAFLKAYLELHNTKPDAATLKRAKAIIAKYKAKD